MRTAIAASGHSESVRAPRPGPCLAHARYRGDRACCPVVSTRHGFHAAQLGAAPCPRRSALRATAWSRGQPEVEQKVVALAPEGLLSAQEAEQTRPREPLLLRPVLEPWALSPL